MIWFDYTVHSGINCFAVEGDWPGEVMGRDRNGEFTGNALYQPGDVFVVDSTGWLRKQNVTPGDVLMSTKDGSLVKFAAQTLE